MPMIVSIGEPKRNKDYHSAVSPKRKSDNTESLAMARFGIVEKPLPPRPIPPAFVILREIASRLQGAVKDSTRAINRCHNLVSRIGNIRNCEIAEKKLLKMLTGAMKNLPHSGHCQIITIPGIGPGTASVLVAKMVDIERFAAPENVVGYFGIFPEEKTSGVDRRGRDIPPGTMAMTV